jgi:hypothetical protein
MSGTANAASSVLMKTVLVSMLMVLSFLLSPASQAGEQTHYVQSDPSKGYSADFQNFCSDHKRVAQDKYQKQKGCQGPSETGVELKYEPDSSCICNVLDEPGRPEGSPDIECTFGIHWTCETR